MPIEYGEGVRAEHVSVRERCGIFDVSHMGEIETRGEGALALLQRVLSNDVSKIGLKEETGGVQGGAQYSVICAEDGAVLDDVFTYRLDANRYLTVTNAANHADDLAWFRKLAEETEGAEVIDRFDDYAMLAVQGPRAREAGPRERFVAFVIEGRGIARAGNEVVGGGVVTSGTFSPSLNVGIGLGYVPAERARPGTHLEIDVRGKIRDALVKEKPLYEK